MSDAVLAFDALEAAITQEREALLASDVDMLAAANQAKLDALSEIEKISFGAEMGERVAALAEANRMNGLILTRRRQEVRWALGFLGYAEVDGTYGADGSKRMAAPSRYLGEG